MNIFVPYVTNYSTLKLINDQSAKVKKREYRNDASSFKGKVSSNVLCSVLCKYILDTTLHRV